MPRPLPWSKPTDSKTASASASARKHPSATTGNASSSRPPKRPRTATPRHEPPEDDLANLPGMLPGDEEWIMVEDEFLATANLFTRSLHEAEYEKLAAAAKTKHSSRISRIQRSSAAKATPKSRDLLKKRESAARERLQRTGGVEDDDEEEVDCSTELGTLMRGGRGKEANLLGKIGTQHSQATTRAAAGYTGKSGSQSQSQRASLATQPSIYAPGRREPQRIPSPHHTSASGDALDPVDDLDLDEDEPPPSRRRHTADAPVSSSRPKAPSSGPTKPSARASRSSTHPSSSSYSSSPRSTTAPNLSSSSATSTSYTRAPSTSATSTQSSMTTSITTPLEAFRFSSFDFAAPTSRFRGKSAAAKQRALAGSVLSSSRSITEDTTGEERERRRKSGEADMVKALSNM